MILIHLYGVLLFFYVTFRLILPAPLPPRGKALAATLALLVSQYHLCVRFLSGSLSSPEMPYFVLAAFSAAFIVMTVIFALLLLRDGLRLGLLLVRKLTCRRSTPFSPGRRAVALAGLGLTVGAYGFKEALQIPAVKTTEIFLRRLPAALHGLVVVQLTDLHASALLHAPRVAAIVAAVNALRPDLIVCTGDLVDGTTTNRDADVAPLGLLRARYGVYACEGNHEYYADYAGWMRHFAALGLPLLHNAHTVVDIGGTPLVIAGLNDPMAPLFGRPGPDLEKALAGAPAGAATLLLAHQPVGARENAAHGIDLQISGHTHGGQMLGFDQIVAARNDGFVRGLYDVDAMRLFVGPGVGLWAGFPVGLGVPAEISRLVLRTA